MNRSVALLVLALSCATAFPVLFITYEEGDNSHKNPRLLECVSTSPSLSSASFGPSYRCRPSAKNPGSLGLKAKDLPVLEIVDKPQNDIIVEIKEEITIPEFQTDGLFDSSDVVVKGDDSDSSDRDRYKVVRESKTKEKTSSDCSDDEVFVAELSVCAPYEPPPPKTAKFNDDDSEIEEINPDFKILKVGYEPIVCPPKEIYLPSIGICAPADNCWPHKDCSHHDDEDKDDD